MKITKSQLKQIIKEEIEQQQSNSLGLGPEIDELYAKFNSLPDDYGPAGAKRDRVKAKIYKMLDGKRVRVSTGIRPSNGQPYGTIDKNGDQEVTINYAGDFAIDDGYVIGVLDDGNEIEVYLD